MRAKVQDNFLSLPDGVFFLGDRDCGSQILLRNSYQLLIDRLQVLLEQKYHRFLITGMPPLSVPEHNCLISLLPLCRDTWHWENLFPFPLDALASYPEKCQGHCA